MIGNSVVLEPSPNLEDTNSFSLFYASYLFMDFHTFTWENAPSELLQKEFDRLRALTY